MLWKDYRCKKCGFVQRNVPSSTEDKERECAEPSCKGRAVVILYPHPTKFKGGGWTTPRHVEAFPGESEDPRDWNAETHGVAGSLERGFESQDKEW